MPGRCRLINRRPPPFSNMCATVLPNDRVVAHPRLDSLDAPRRDALPMILVRPFSSPLHAGRLWLFTAVLAKAKHI